MINGDGNFDKNNDHYHLLMVTGQIPRGTSFEKGLPPQYKEEEEKKNINNSNEKKLVPDPLVNDDQAIIAKIKDKGLVIITGGGHAGIVNTMNYAKNITGINKFILF